MVSGLQFRGQVSTCESAALAEVVQAVHRSELRSLPGRLVAVAEGGELGFLVAFQLGADGSLDPRGAFRRRVHAR